MPSYEEYDCHGNLIGTHHYEADRYDNPVSPPGCGSNFHVFRDGSLVCECGKCDNSYQQELVSPSPWFELTPGIDLPLIDGHHLHERFYAMGQIVKYKGWHWKIVALGDTGLNYTYDLVGCQFGQKVIDHAFEWQLNNENDHPIPPHPVPKLAAGIPLQGPSPNVFDVVSFG